MRSQAHYQCIHDAQTQWVDPGMEDHTHSRGPAITCNMRTPSQELPCCIADGTLQNDADPFFYTGIPLVEFHTLVSCLQPFTPPTSSMPVVDQILMKLKKLRQSFVMANLERRF